MDSIASQLKKGVIERIKLRVSAVSQASVTSEQIVEEIDAQGVPYRVFELNLDEF